MTTYSCSACNGRVSILDGVVSRECGHDMEGIDAHVSATATGMGSAAIDDGRLAALRAFFRSILRRLRGS